jgi:hypothetical protein
MSPAAVVAAVGCLQAQVPAAAELGIGVRLAGCNEGTVRRAIREERSIVRTYGNRSTVHLVAAAELPMWMAAMRAAKGWRSTAWYEKHGLDTVQTDSLIAALHDALDGRSLTREELATEVAARAGAWARPRFASQWADLIDTACYAGAACYVPAEGTRVRFARPDQWLGGWDEPDEGAALMTVVLRFLSVYGPARTRDIAIWLAGGAMRPRQVEPIVAALGDAIETVSVEGQRGLMPAADVAGAAGMTFDGPSVVLLPQYDAYLLGCRLGREVVVPDTLRELVLSIGKYYYEGPVQHQVLLVDGVVRGVWAWDRERPSWMHVHLLRPLHRDERAGLEAAAARIGVFYGRQVEVRPVATYDGEGR